MEHTCIQLEKQIQHCINNMNATDAQRYGSSSFTLEYRNAISLNILAFTQLISTHNTMCPPKKPLCEPSGGPGPPGRPSGGFY